MQGAFGREAAELYLWTPPSDYLDVRFADINREEALRNENKEEYGKF